MPGLTRVCSVPRHSPPRSLTAPTSVMAQCAGEPPVVSRSTTTKVTSHNGVPRSSNDRCMARHRTRTHVRYPASPNCADFSLQDNEKSAQFGGEGSEGVADEAEGRGPQRQQRLVEPAVRVLVAPLGPGLVAQRQDLQLAPRVTAVGGVVA